MLSAAAASSSKTNGEQLSDAVYKWLKAAVERPNGPPLEPRTVAFDANVSQFGLPQMQLVLIAYRSHSDPVERRRQAASRSFRAKYIGDAANQFQDYLLRCWERYAPRTTSAIAYPYAVIVQSAGFGKSRLLQQLAEQTKSQGPQAKLRVLYTCIHTEHSQVVFPRATRSLNDYFFFLNAPLYDTPPVDNLAARLYTVYVYALQHWDLIGQYWFPLFQDGNSKDREVARQLRARCPASIWALPNVSEALKIAAGLTDEKRVLVLAIDEARDLLGYDRARDYDRKRFFRLWRYALELANNAIARQFHENAGILAVFVDSPGSDTLTLAPPMDWDPVSCTKPTRTELLPPFVLTHTMDVHHTRRWLSYEAKHGPGSCPKAQFYKHLVARRAASMDEKEEAWQDLVAMGRSLWKSLELSKNELIVAAAGTLALRPVWIRTTKVTGSAVLFFSARVSAYDSATSVLCRLGLRPNSSSPLAATAVADLMAVLAYANQACGQYVCDYSSDPILALGAAYLWHNGNEPEPLANTILPQFRKLLRHESINIGEGGVNEVVARIVLLLAMDACQSSVGGTSDSYRGYAGKLYPLTTFLRVLQGPAVAIRRPPVTGEEHASQSEGGDLRMKRVLEEKWADWHVGFSHFVQLDSEPTEESLWMLLSRRAAAILPAPLRTGCRQQRGAAFLIPAVRLSAREEDEDTDKQVAAILVHVTHDFIPDEETDAELFSGLWRAFESGENRQSESVLSGVDSGSSSLPTNKPLLWVCMDFDGDAAERPRRFLYSRDSNMTENGSVHSLWLRGVDAWAGDSGDGKKPVKFISSAVAHELSLLLLSSSSSMNVMQLINDDFQEAEKEQQRDAGGLEFKGNRKFFSKKKKSLRFFRDAAREMAACALPTSLRTAVSPAKGVEAGDQEEDEEFDFRSNAEVRPVSPQASPGRSSEPAQRPNGALSGRKREEDEREAEVSLFPAALSDSTKHESPKKKIKKRRP